MGEARAEGMEYGRKVRRWLSEEKKRRNTEPDDCSNFMTASAQAHNSKECKLYELKSTGIYDLVKYWCIKKNDFSPPPQYFELFLWGFF